ncbi:MAG: Dabb family protein [Flavobacteriaceae bacterium]
MLRVGVADRIAFILITLFYVVTLSLGYFCLSDREGNFSINSISDEKKLVHLVLIQFKSTIDQKDLSRVTDGAYSLQKIQGVESLNFGKNVSPEGLNKGYTHSLTMKFNSSIDRDSVYLPHPIHQRFVKLFVPLTESILVYDFWE